MKKYRAFVPFVLIAVMLLSWYMMYDNYSGKEAKFNNYIKIARQKADVKITSAAIENYRAALLIKDDPDIYVEVAKYYAKIGDSRNNIKWCQEFLNKYPKNAKAYDCLLKAYMNDKNYDSCFDVLSTAKRKKVTSKYMEETYQKIKYEYTVLFSTYEEVGSFSGGACAVKGKTRWGFINESGTKFINMNYTEVGSFTGSGYAPVTVYDENTKNSEAYFINKKGQRVLATKEKYLSFGLIVDGILSAKQQNGKYVYLNENFEKLFNEEYDFASTFNSGIAAVKKGNKWFFIDSKGKKLFDQEYLDVKLDEKLICFRNERAFVSASVGKYMMIDTKGNQVGTEQYDDARLFLSELETVVKKGNQWFFIDKNGKNKSDETYEDARPYKNQLAAVKMNGHWGYVDTSEKIVIQPEFDDAGDFNTRGLCFIKQSSVWKPLRIYSLSKGM